MPQEQALRYLAASDMCVVPLRKAELFLDTIPSKIYEVMACARPVLLGVDGEARELLESACGGLFFEPENAQALAQIVQKLADDPSLRQRLGENGREYVVKHYDKSVLAHRYLDILASLVDRPSGCSDRTPTAPAP
jgi:glycosyltransferase involved in cell wall biosynthesis